MNTHKKLIRIAATVVAVAAVAVAVGFALRGGSASAAGSTVSLPHVQDITDQILDDGGSFVILEIVPRADSGSIGYLVDGQEPVADWEKTLGAMYGKAAREEYMTALFGNLEAMRIMGDTAPLTQTNGYTEYYPWETPIGEPAALTLASDETSTVTGTYTPTENGNYLSTWEYRRPTEGETPGYAQNITSFEYGTKTEPGYYYSPVFKLFYGGSPEELEELEDEGLLKLGEDGMPIQDESHTGLAIYELTAATETVPEHYTYVGVFGTVVLNLNRNYYYVESTGAPSEAWNADSAPYAAASTEYRPETDATKAYFVRTQTGFRYVTDESGDYDLTAGTETTWNITYDTVYYNSDCGWTNNNWFMRYVLDINSDDDDFNEYKEHVFVNSMTADKVTATNVAAADLIVLSGGLKLDGSGSYSESYNTGSGVDISSGVYTELYNAVTLDTRLVPVIVDYALVTETDSQIGALARELVQSYANDVWQSVSDDDFVYQNLLTLPGGLTGSTSDGLSVFNTLLTESATAEGFAAVSSEIEYQNFLRQQYGGEPLLSGVTPARAVRYIINYGGQRKIQPKTAIKVLEIEPSTEESKISQYTVNSWLGGSAKSGIRDDKIEITTMSMYEFVGKIEDLNETYDLIYIGDSTEGMNKTGSGIANYNDDGDSYSMDGLLYTNIGDTFKLNTVGLTGMLDRDYDSDADVQTFRFSGNDLTESRMDDIANFAGAGYPVILADSLVDKELIGLTLVFSVSIQADEPTQNGLRLSATLKDESGRNVTSFPGATYTWFQATETDGIPAWLPMSGESGSTVEGQAGYCYYCKVSIGSGTPAISNAVRLVASNTTQFSGGDAVTYIINESGWQSFTAAISGALNNGSVTFTATLREYNDTTLTLPDGMTVSYQWQSRERQNGGHGGHGGNGGNWGNWGAIGAASSSPTLTLNAEDYEDCQVRCVVTIGSSKGPAQSNRYEIEIKNNGSIELSNEEYGKGDNSGKYATHWEVFSVALSGQDMGNGEFTITAKAWLNNALLSSGMSYQWFKEGEGWIYGENNSTLNRSSSATEGFYCDVTYQGKTHGSSIITTSFQGITAQALTSPAKQNGSYKSYGAINTARIDNSSTLYYGLSAILSFGNVMYADEAKDDSDSTLQYLNLSKPEIELTLAPTEYAMTPEGMNANVSGRTLNYTFSINNATDPTPSTTTYDCRLYIDLDSDGIFSGTEQITDVVISAGGMLLSPNSEGVYKLKNGIECTLSRTMPSEYAGIIPWKLEVAKNVQGVDGKLEGSPYIHASLTGYTRIAPDTPDDINILQINSDSDSTLDLSDSDTFGNLIDAVKDFNINITTKKARELDGKTKDAVADILDDYNMLIIGFGDMYQELSDAASRAIVDYIDTGKAVLFTHDTTSLTNTPDNQNISDNNSPSRWGYYFNSVLRPAVGLDRYGIRSTDSLSETESSSARTLLNNFASNGATLTGYADDLTEADFTVAYRPNSGRNEFVADVQGYSNYSLIRYATANDDNLKFSTDANGYENDRTTTKVSQVNAGQITTYPYTINTAKFAGTGTSDTMAVATTHEQYYQVNMNSDDIVVWYCLDSDYYLHNDVTNAYYIYSKGNVTYSGAGHSTGIQGDEAKLFINTMIAAFRTSNEAPTVDFSSDADGNASSGYYFLTSDGNGAVLESAFAANSTDSTAVYFKITDPTLKQNKSLSVDFFYSVDGDIEDIEAALARDTVELPSGVTKFNPSLYLSGSADTGAVTTVLGGRVYMLHLPNEIMSKISNDSVTEVQLFVRVITTIGTGADAEVLAPAVDCIQIRRLGLFDLK